MKRIYLVGSINTDLVIRAPYMPKQGETLLGEGFFSAHGGKGANQAVAAARSGAEVRFCGAVGNDVFGKDALKSLQQEGIDCSSVSVRDGVPSGTAVIVVVDGDNRILLDSGANGTLSNEDIDAFLESAKPGDYYLTQLENPIDAIGYGLRKAKEKGLVTVLNPAPANQGILSYLPYVDILAPNETECELFGGAEKLRNLVKTLIITLGGDGYRIVDPSGDHSYPCRKIQTVDTTAAGDTFCGAMLARLCEGDSLEGACAYGSKAASLACTRKGAQPSIPTKKEILDW